MAVSDNEAKRTTTETTKCEVYSHGVEAAGRIAAVRRVLATAKTSKKKKELKQK